MHDHLTIYYKEYFTTQHHNYTIVDTKDHNPR